MKDAYTVKEIAQAMRVTERAAHARAVKESWPFEEQPCRGGRRRLYVAVSLPAEVRDALTAYEGANLPAAVAADETALTEDQRRGALARADLVRLYTEAMARAPRKGIAQKEFLSAYRAGVWPKIKEVLGDAVSAQSLERWKLKLRRTGSALSLCPLPGHGQGL